MGPLEIGLGLLLLQKYGKDGGGTSAGGWRQLCPNSKGQYVVPPSTLFVVDVDAGSPVAPILTKQLQDMKGQVLPPTSSAIQMPIDWPADDEARSQTGRMRGVAKSTASLAIDMGSAPRPTRVWMKG